MKPAFITFTGVDDDTDPAGLVQLADDYPVEFGLLFSPKRQGLEPRYPKLSTIAWLTEELPLRWAAHLCGDDARAWLYEDRCEHDLRKFQRVQINTADPNVQPSMVGNSAAKRNLRAILQCRGDFPRVASVDVLFDASGGRGIEAKAWPAAARTTFCGYAGGLKPENVAEAVANIGAQDELNYWIDMESGVRDERDRFSLEKCRAVCEAVYGPSGVTEAHRPLGCALAMRVMQSDLFQQLDEGERADCDELVRRNVEWFKADSAHGVGVVQTPSGGVVWTPEDEARLDAAIAKRNAARAARGVRAVEQPRHDDGSPAPEDTIAKCKRILTAVDTYHDQPTQATRSDLRHVIYAELERAAASGVGVGAPAWTPEPPCWLVERRAEGCTTGYLGHAALTARLLDADPQWSWEPAGSDERGLPALDSNGGLWIKLTVCGVTRFGYGDAQGKTGPDAMKERIGDALRNAAMRFGAALDLWHKGDLYAHEHGEDEERPEQRRPASPALDTSPKARAQRITQGVKQGDEANAAAAMSGWDKPLLDAVWALLAPEVQDKLTAVWPEAQPA